MNTIRFRIDANGEVSIAVSGTTGTACDDLTKAFEQELGVVTSKQRTDAYYCVDQEEDKEVQHER